MSINGRYVAGSAVVLLAIGFLTLLLIIAATIWLNERAQVYFADVIDARDTRSSAGELRSALQAAESSQRGYVVTSNEIYLAPYDSAKTRARNELDRLDKGLAKFPETSPMMKRLAAVVGEKIDEMDRTIALKSGLQDAEALALIRTNRGKALMDEANVFLSGIILSTDERLTAGVSEQRANAALLRWISVIGGIVIVLVVTGVVITVLRYTREVAQARDEVRILNTSLEQRVKDRTADLERARDHAQVLVTEVNHRVANSLSMVASMVRLQSNAVSDSAAKQALEEMQGRIIAISLVHQRLYTSGDVRFVALDEYLSSLLSHLKTTMQDSAQGVSLRYDLEPVSLPTDTSVNLGVVVTEWVTNAFKYAYPGGRGEVRVRLNHLPDKRVELVVEDDGIGRRDEHSAQGSGLGTRIVTAMANTMGAEVRYLTRQPGTLASLTFPLPFAKMQQA